MTYIASMTLCLILILMLILAAIYQVSTDDDGTPHAWFLLAFAVILAVVWGIGGTLVTGFHQVGSGEIGIVRNLSGVVQNQVLDPGTHFVTPPWNEVDVVDTKTQSYAQPAIEGVSRDSQSIQADVQVNYHLNPAEVPTLFRSVGANWFLTFVPPTVQQDVKEAFTRYHTVDIAPNRAKIVTDLTDRLRSDLSHHSVYVDAVYLTNFNYSQAFDQSIEQRQIASQRAQRAKLDAQARINEAYGEQQATEIVAQGQAKANQLLSRSLTRNIIQWTFVQKLAPGIKAFVPSNGIYNLGSLTQ